MNGRTVDNSTGLDRPVYRGGECGSWHLKRGCAPPGSVAVELDDVIGDDGDTPDQ